MRMKINRKYFVEEGRKGVEKRWANYRLELINELTKLSGDKKFVDFAMNFSNSSIREAIDVLRKKKDERKGK